MWLTWHGCHVVDMAVMSARPRVQVLRKVFDGLSRAWAEVMAAAASGRGSPAAAANMLSPAELSQQVRGHVLCGCVISGWQRCGVNLLQQA
jgi:hypothetical protein